MGLRHSLGVSLAVLVLGGFTIKAWHQPPEQRPKTGLIGGPYKVIAADFTGDRIPDLILSYEPSDALTVERGDGLVPTYNIRRIAPYKYVFRKIVTKGNCICLENVLQTSSGRGIDPVDGRQPG